MRARFALLLLLAACDGVPATNENAGPGAGGALPGDGKADGVGAGFEVVLTQPHCDVCTAADKAWLQKRSAVVERVVALIDGAQETIDVAQFTFSVPAIEAALKRAHARGVAIRIAMDAGQSQGDNPSRRLEAAGVDVKFVRGKGNGEYAGLQHAKFMLVDGATLLTGSNNWSSTGTTINEENVTVVRGDEALVGAFTCHFEAMWAAQHDAAGACSVPGRVAFSPGTAPIALLADGIREAQQSVDVLMHHLLFDKLQKELARAAERGVRVRVLVNAADRAETQGGLWNRMRTAGVQIRYKQTNGDLYQLQHNKLAIIDGRVLLNGSGNWSGSAFFNNWENFVRYDRPEVVTPFVELYARLWAWSLTAESLDAGTDAARQHAAETRVFFGNLHAHYHAAGDDHPWDDGKPQRKDEAGQLVSVDVGADHAAAARFAFEYARDAGGMDFLALSPHVVDDREGDRTPNMQPEGWTALRSAAEAVTAESGGAFLGLASMEWSTNSEGNHVNILGTKDLAKVERGRFDTLYDEWLPNRARAGERPILMFNHPRTFRENEEFLTGSWDQIFGRPLTDLPKKGERADKFNDYGLDDYAPLKEVRGSWIDGTALPDEGIVAETLANIEAASRPYLRLMEVTVGRGTDLGSEHPENPSLSTDAEGRTRRYTKIHDDWDYFLRHGFRMAPAANHDNHFANWGTGHTTRTAVLAPALTEADLMAAIDARAVYATEDEDLELRFAAAGRVPMGGELRTLDDRVTADLFVADATYTGRFAMRLMRGTIGGEKVEAVQEIAEVAPGAWQQLALDLPAAGRHFFYVELHAVDADRMAWSAPIWVERLQP